MPKKYSFISQFFKESKMVGSVRPSSRFLMKKMLQNIDFENSKVIVELGPGTGVFTHELLKKMAPDAVLIIFELNEQFIRILKRDIDDKRAIFVADSAEKIEEYLKINNIQNADVVVSSLPLFNFPQVVRETIITNSYKILKNTGKYIQFQYSTQAKKLLTSTFDEVTIAFTPLNVPPAFVYTCEKK